MSTQFQRQPAAAAQNRYDLTVVGGGIYGIMLTLEAARRGYKTLLLEQHDFHAGVSFNSLRIIHGGLRYLQHMDIRRYFESVNERRWFMRHMPDQVKPLKCLMPLYGRGLKRPSTFGCALKLNDLLGIRRNAGVVVPNHLPAGGIVGINQTRQLFPAVETRGLQGAGLWHDGLMVNHQRLSIELLRWARACGAVVLNYTQARALQTQGNVIAAVEALDRVSGASLSFKTTAVINAAGPQVAWLAERFDRPAPLLFPPTLSFNLLLDHPAIAQTAVAIQPPQAYSRMYFVLPWRGKMLAGTHQAAYNGPLDNAQPTEAQLDEFTRDLSEAVPGLRLTRQHILRVYAGLLPAAKPGDDEPSHRPTWIEHAQHGGPTNLYSVSGVKYTTARLVAEQTLRRIYKRKLKPYGTQSIRPPAEDALDFFDYRPNLSRPEALRRVAAMESVVCLDDMVHRRADWGAEPAEAHAAREALRSVLHDMPDHPPTHTAHAAMPTQPQAA